MPHETDDFTAVRITWPIAKALPNGDDGSILHAGVASDESFDVQDDRIPQELLGKSFAYLKAHGKFVWDHGKEDIGDVLGVQHVTPEEAMSLFDVPITKSGTACWGTVYPLVDPVLASNDLRTAHHRMRAGARLGYSVDGVCVRKSNGELSSMLITRVAITPQPVNPHTGCRVLAKSLSAALEHVGVSDTPLPALLDTLGREPDVVVDCTSAGADAVCGEHVIVSKALWGHLVRIAFQGRREKLPALGKLEEALRSVR